MVLPEREVLKTAIAAAGFEFVP